MITIKGPRDAHRVFSNIRKLHFKAMSLDGSKMSWNHIGKGSVNVKVDYNKIYFNDEIILESGEKLTDKKLWIFSDDLIEFYHFRSEKYEKIFRYEYIEESFKMTEQYNCSPDIYTSKLEFFQNKIFFVILIVGERKNEKLEYMYSS